MITVIFCQVIGIFSAMCRPIFTRSCAILASTTALHQGYVRNMLLDRGGQSTALEQFLSGPPGPPPHARGKKNMDKHYMYHY